MKKIFLLLTVVALSGCLKIPEGVTPVQAFELEKYLGKWYEIARLDHSFERGLEQVTAEYSLREDGGIHVVNRGYLKEENRWKEATGKAYFVADPGTGYLKVSFFGPFYGAYVVFGLDKVGYEYAFVCGPDKSYLWLLSRSPTVGDELLAHFIEVCDDLGFETGNLVFVEQDTLGHSQ